MSLINTLHWRYSTKKFDPTKKIPEDQVTDLLKGINLGPSSYGLQPYELIVIHNKELQHNLVEHSFNQQQVADASHVVVIAARKNITKKYIKDYISDLAQLRKQSIDDLAGFQQMMLDTVGAWSADKQLLWAKNQSYIALGVMMSLCADMHIDSCPMEGFVSSQYNEILGLGEQGLEATLVIPIGYRSADDQMQNVKKYRKELGELVQLRY